MLEFEFQTHLNQKLNKQLQYLLKLYLIAIKLSDLRCISINLYKRTTK